MQSRAADTPTPSICVEFIIDLRVPVIFLSTNLPIFQFIIVLPNRRRCHRRSSSTLNFQRLDDEREFVDLSAGELVELQVLEEMNAVDNERDLMDWKTEV